MPRERTERYQHLMLEGGHSSVRALAEAIGEDFSKISRILKVLDLPEPVLSALRAHASSPAVRRHFTAERLKQLSRNSKPEQILSLIAKIVQTTV